VNQFEKLQQTIGVTFSNLDLLKEALTHRSYINENPKWGVPHNERLEFLGDAVLELVVTEHLYHAYPQAPEGELTSIRAALVNYQILARIADDIHMHGSILLSRGEAKDTARAKEVILANAFESLIGAIYLDQGYAVAARFITEQVLSHSEEIVEKKLHKDPKSHLQEIIQEKYRVTPRYVVMSEEGPDHNKIFEIGVYFGEEFAAKGKGFSKQEGEIEAAKNALKKFGVSPTE
jgi:ribonuclease-3